MQRDVLALYLQEELGKLPPGAKIKTLSYTARQERQAPRLNIEQVKGDSKTIAHSITLDDGPVVTGQHAHKVMHRYQCGSCDKTWSIEGDQLESGNVLTCPHCGTLQTFSGPLA